MDGVPARSSYYPTGLDVPAAKVVEFKDVVKKFGSKTVLGGVSFTIEAGSVFALLGENGAGKTTTLRLILGETAPTAGQIRVFDRVPRKQIKDVRDRIGFLPETPKLYEYMTVGQIGRFAAAFNRQGYLQDYAAFCEEFDLNPRVRIKTLSKGMKAKTSLALELARDPELILLDEPTSGLDALIRRQILSHIAELGALGKSVLLSSHQTAEVERVADHVAFLKDGQFVLVDSIENIRETTRVVETMIADAPDDDSLTPLFATLFDDELVAVERFGGMYRALGRELSYNYKDRLRTSLDERLLHTEVSVPSLEDVFVAYMQRSAR